MKELIQGEGDRQRCMFSWRRRLSEEERGLEMEIRKKVDMVSLKDKEEDKWVCAKNSYLVKEAYSLILHGYVTEDSRELVAV